MAAITSAEAPRIKRSDAVPRILCAGVIGLDEVFRVEELPRPDGKVQAHGFFVVNGGCAANAAVAIARLGGRALLAGPMGGPKGKTLTATMCSARLSANTLTAASVSAFLASPRLCQRFS
jgi:sugar/nucleoside kinase (ribokinase family)